MKAIKYRCFFIWNFDKEENWLNEMAAKGLVLANVCFIRYVFESCSPGEYNIRLEMLNNSVNHAESRRYIRFLEDIGVECICNLSRWVYFRKKAESAPFDLFSDIDSRIGHLKRILLIPAILGFANAVNAINMTMRFVQSGYEYVLAPMLLTWAVSVWMAYGYMRLCGKKKKLETERMLHE